MRKYELSLSCNVVTPPRNSTASARGQSIHDHGSHAHQTVKKGLGTTEFFFSLSFSFFLLFHHFCCEILTHWWKVHIRTNCLTLQKKKKTSKNGEGWRHIRQIIIRLQQSVYVCWRAYLITVGEKSAKPHQATLQYSVVYSKKKKSSFRISSKRKREKKKKRISCFM